jgi:hypothetical protein
MHSREPNMAVDLSFSVMNGSGFSAALSVESIYSELT